MPNKKLKYTFTRSQRSEWKNLHINIDSFCDKWEDGVFEDFESKLDLLEEADIKILIKYFGVSMSAGKTFKTALYEDRKACVEIYCIIRFAFDHRPKVICQLLDIPIHKGKVDKRLVILAVLEQFKSKILSELFLRLLKQKTGSGHYNFKFNSKLEDADFGKLKKVMRPMVSLLKRHDKQKKTYHIRQAYKGEDSWVFLLLKETADTLFPAIPDNKRVIKGQYIFITVKAHEQSLTINTRSKIIAYSIRNYLQRKIDNPVHFQRRNAKYDPTKFFKSILDISSTSQQLKLVDVRFRTSEIDSSLGVTDKDHKNNIIEQLKTLKDKDLVKLADLSEFQFLTFYYQGLRFKVNVELNKWGSYRIHLLDSGKPVEELFDFKRDFETVFNVPFDTYLRNSDSVVDEKRIARHILNKRTLESNIPEVAESVLLQLIKSRLLLKPTKTSKRKCTNCRKYTWEPGDCPSCGNEARIEGDYIDLLLNKKGIYNFVFGLLKVNSNLSVVRTKKQIKGSKFDLIDLLDGKGNPLTVYISHGNVSEKIIQHYRETGNSLMIILSKFKGAFKQEIIKNGFECVGLSDLFAYRNNQDLINSRFEEYVEIQHQKWQAKLVEKGLESYQRLSSKPTEYSDQDFEVDIYNLLHEMFMVGDRLGGKFTGVAAPDGIVSIHNAGIPRKRYCIAWDCKYSLATKGYQLADKPKKHRKYINDLKSNEKVLFYGGLKTYAIISQNMDFSKYSSFYNKLVHRFRWKGNVLYISEIHVLKIYRFYKDNSNVFLLNPSGFYQPLYRLLSVIYKKDSVPYPSITVSRLSKFFVEVEEKYKGKELKFEFKRDEF